MSQALSFQSVKFDVIQQNQQPWVRSPQIGEALGYAKGGISIAKLYEAHADEFTDAMTAVVTLPTEGGPQETRIFSLRGCHLLAMFARTPIAKQFRRWVLDVLDKLAEEERAKAEAVGIPDRFTACRPSRRTDPERKALTAIINTWVGMAPVHYASARAQVNAHFGVASVDALTVAQVKEAIRYVQGKIDALPPAPALPPAALPEAERPPLYRDGMFHLPRINPQHVPGPREAALHELWGNWWKLEENARTAFDAMLHELADCRGDLFTHAMSDMGRNADTFFNPDAMTEGFLCPYHAAETAFRQALHLARVHLKMALNAAVMLHR